MEKEIQGVKNYSTLCQVVDNNLKMEYKIIEGPTNKSYGINIMKMLKFP